MSLGEVIKQRRTDRDLTQDTVASKVGISKPYLSNIETGRATQPPSDRIVRALERTLGFNKGDLSDLAERMRTPPRIRQTLELLEGEVKRLQAIVKKLLTKGPRDEAGGLDLDVIGKQIGEGRTVVAGPSIPVINKVVAGYPAYFTDMDYPPGIAEDYIRCPDVHDPQAFAARVVGNSMEPIYREGDIVVFTPNRPAEPGDDCFVRFAEDGGTTFKRFYQDAEGSLRLQPLNSRYPAEVYPRERITGLWPAKLQIQKPRGAEAMP